MRKLTLKSLLSFFVIFSLEASGAQLLEIPGNAAIGWNKQKWHYHHLKFLDKGVGLFKVFEHKHKSNLRSYLHSDVFVSSQTESASLDFQTQKYCAELSTVRKALKNPAKVTFMKNSKGVNYCRVEQASFLGQRTQVIFLTNLENKALKHVYFVHSLNIEAPHSLSKKEVEDIAALINGIRRSL